MDEDETLPLPVRRLIRRLREARDVSSSTTTSDATESVQRGSSQIPDLKKRRDYAHGEQFRGGTYWRGRKPKNNQFAEILKLYKQNNQITRCLRTVVSGVLGRDPEWSLQRRAGTDRTGQPKLVTSKKDRNLRTLEGQGGDWHRDSALHKALQRAKFIEQWAGVAYVRLYIPGEFAEETPMEAGSLGSMEEALEVLCVQAVEPGEGGAIRDDHDRIVGYWYEFEEVNPDAPTGTGEKRIELHTPERNYILDSSYNVLKDEDGVQRSGPNPLYDPTRRRRPRFMMFEMRRDDGPAVTSDVIDAQDALNVSGTYQRRNEDIAGFRSLVLINAKAPKDPEGNATTWKLAADVTLDLEGIDLDSSETDYGTGLPNAQKRVATPSYGVIEPVDPAHFQKSEAGYKADIYDAFDQMHLYSPFMAISGAAKREDRNPYEKRIIGESGTIAGALAWAVESALGTAAWLCGKVADLLGVSCKPRLYLDVSQGSIDLWSALVAGYPDSVSLETLVEVNPAVTDAEAEMERLKKQRAERQTERDAEVENARRQLETA